MLRWRRQLRRGRASSNVVVVVHIVVGVVVVVSVAAGRGSFPQFLALHSSVLEPDLDLPFGETGPIGELVTLLFGDVSVGQILFFQEVSDPLFVRLPFCPALAARCAGVKEIGRV